MENHICNCCGGDLPPYEVWQVTRIHWLAKECPGHIDSRTGRCGGFADERLWALPAIKHGGKQAVRS